MTLETTDEFLQELRDIQTSLTIRGTATVDEWLLDLAYRLYDAVETHKEKLNQNNENEDSN